MLRVLGRGLNTDQLKEDLQETLGRKLEEWKSTAESQILEHRGERELHISRPIKASVIYERRNKTKKYQDILQLLEESPRDARIIIITGEAGSGKTSLLRYITRVWIEENRIKNNLAFYIPLGRTQSPTIPDIICYDMELIKTRFKDDLSIALQREKSRPLFLLDSFEEMSTKHEAKELKQLIRNEIYPHATVIVTTRPGSKLKDVTKDLFPRIEANLEDFSRDEVSQYVEKYFARNRADATPEIAGKFFGMPFLQRPINLALACYLYDVNRGSTESLLSVTTQTVLMTQIIRHILQAYVQKINGREVDLSNDVLLRNKGPGTHIRSVVKEIARMCYFAFRKTQQWLKPDDDSVIKKEDLIDFGLFTAGQEEGCVTLPHLLFQEYLAAMYLLADKPSWEALYAEFQAKSEGTDSSTKSGRRRETDGKCHQVRGRIVTRRCASTVPALRD